MKNNSEISVRISKVIDYLGINANSFALKLGYERAQTVYDVINGKSAPSFDFFKRFLNSEYSDIISIKWLITGNGLMISKNQTGIDDEIRDNKSQPVNYELKNDFHLRTDSRKESQSIPLYNLEAAAGLVPLFNEASKPVPLDYISIPNLPKCDGAIYVVGDSMYPLLKSGDIVLYKQVHDIQNGIFYGEMYLLSLDMSGEEYIVVKYIQKSDIPDHVKLVSYNTHHSEKDVLISNIRALAYVKASIRINSMI